MNLYVVRHGQTDWNVKNLLQGSTDVKLNKNGIAQAYETAKNLVDVHFDAIYCSPLSRTVDTANIINSGRNLRVITDDRLLEREFGNFEGLPGIDVNLNDFWNFDMNLTCNNVEPIFDFFKRIKCFLSDIISNFGNSDKNILVVTHNGVNLAISALLGGLPDNIFSLNLAPCEYKVFSNPIIVFDDVFFSIVIPAYNAESFIHATLDSVFRQTYKNFEIIVVDDCSTDNTYSILKQYNNIKLFQTPRNIRQGGARNLGIENCIGDYIIFLDSDDTFYDTNCLENLNLCIKKNNCPDIVYTGMKISGNRNMTILPDSDNCKKDYRLSDYKWANVVTICWKRSLLINNQIRFPDGIRYEDVYFYFLGIEKSKTYAIGDFITYEYNNRQDSTTTTYSLVQAFDTLKIIDKLCDLKDIIDKSNLPFLKKRIEQQISRLPVRAQRAIDSLFDTE